MERFVTSNFCPDGPLEIYYDRGNPRWLAEQRDYCRQEGMRVTERGTLIPARFGSTTASLNRPALFPVEFIEARGLCGEEVRFSTSKLKPLLDYMGTHHRLPPFDDKKPHKQYPPFIQAWIDGSWWVNEGNHRIEAARRLRWKYIPLDIRWYSGGEDYHSLWGSTPGMVVKWDELAHREGYCVEDFRAFP